MAKVLAGLLLVIVVVAILLRGVTAGWFGEDELAGDVVPAPRPAGVVTEAVANQGATVAALGGDASKQILFGDFHVHTTFSFDAFLMNLPMAGGPGTHPPADACDFARFCSALDFWSINDHAENLTPRLWSETVASVRQCNEAAGDPANPDLVTYLGWEWSHIGTTPDDHYGHKNVVLLGTDDEQIPTRPIAARSPATAGVGGLPMAQGLALVALNGERGHDWARFMSEVASTPACADGVPVRDLPDDCRESAPDPETLFAKLDDWDLPALVIPHGTAWGIYTPAGSDWRKQLPGHDPARQSLVEIYSGHGNSEQLPDWREVDVAADGSLRCSEPKDGYLPSCWRAGELLEANCLAAGVDAGECAARAVDARQVYVDAFQAGWKTLPGQPTSDWLDAGQAPDMFQPAFNYRPRSSVQYMLAIRDFEDPENPKRFDFGFLGSSDNHTARPGTGYKEFDRGEMSEGRGAREDGGGIPGFGSASDDTEPVAEAVPFVSSGESPLQLFEIERASAYFVTGGLVAVHSGGRDRRSIWDALQRKEVYATSGRRTLLWFDLIDGQAEVPMGSTVQRSALPRFRVRAAGSFEQQPGCPEHAIEALGQERVDHICRGECHHPGEARRPITRIEIVRIRPQTRANEPLEDLVEDPWRTLPCPADGSGCVVEFSDPDFAEAARDTVYYVRALEAPDELIHGSNPLGCTFDAEGQCVAISPCGSRTPASDDCLSEAEPRAWSSPIYVDYVAPLAAATTQD
jgi:hypothetical protein